MMDKINDNMNANGQKKLSMEDLDKVSGGGFMFKGNYVNDEDLHEAGRELVNQFGFDIAANIMVTQYGIAASEIPMSTNNSEMQRMGILVERIITIYERAQKEGKSY